jgi:uncharacterized phage protein gp47/JayE
MVSTLDQTGLAIEPQTQIVADLVADYQAIYGPDINVDSNSPDGQLINIQAQAISDLLQLLLLTYNSFAVSTAFGERLDQLVELNGISRIAGTFTQAQVVVTITAAQTIPGLDQTVVTPFTVKDDAGNQFQLKTSYVAGAPGTPTLIFQAVAVGKVQTTAATITKIVTPTAGITAVNNPSVASDVLGVNEETDAQLKVRHARSLAVASTGPSDAMEAVLKNVAGVIDAYVVENNTSGVVNGIPANGVWPIVNGGTAVGIAQAIYSKKSPGAPMKGSVTQAVVRPNGSTFTAQWDASISQTLYIKFSVIWIGPQAMSNADISAALSAALVYRLGQNPTIADILAAMRAIAPTAVVSINSSTQGVSRDNASWNSVVPPTDAQHYFVLSAGNVVIS